MSFLLAGLSLGFSAGISPGPLMTLVISATLERGLRAGLQVAFAPLLTDSIMITATLLIFRTLPPLAEQLLTVAGSLFIIYLGVETVRSARHAVLDVTPPAVTDARDIRRGVLVNLLNPHPWIFWLSVGVPLLVSAWEESSLHAATFLAGFFSLLVGGKIALAFAIAGAREHLSQSWYRRLLMLSGLLLAGLGIALFWNGLVDHGL